MTLLHRCSMDISEANSPGGNRTDAERTQDEGAPPVFTFPSRVDASSGEQRPGDAGADVTGSVATSRNVDAASIVTSSRATDFTEVSGAQSYLFLVVYRVRSQSEHRTTMFNKIVFYTPKKI